MAPLPPGPASSALRQAFELGRDPYAFLERCRLGFGDRFIMRLPGDPIRIVLAHPDDIRKVFALPADAYRCEDQSLHLNIGPKSVLLSDGEPHRRKRQILMPPLHGERLRGYAQAMAEVARDHLSRWPHETRFELELPLQDLTLDVLLRCVFGVAPQEARGRELACAVTRWVRASLRPSMFVASMVLTANRLRAQLDRATRRAVRDPLAWGPWRGLGRAKAELLHLLRDDVQRARRDQGRSDVLGLLVHARYDDGSPMDDEDVLDQLVTLLVGGHQTTADSLGWVIHHVLSSPSVEAELRDELQRAFGSGPVDPLAVAELTWLDACIRESMRLAPVAIAAPRTLLRTETFGPYDVPPGTIAWPCVYLAGRHPEVWPRPARFDPNRFIDVAAPRPETWLPFGGGRRRCIGAAFAHMEMRIVLAELFHGPPLRLLGRPERPQFRGLTVVPGDGIPVIRERMSATARA